MKKTVAFLILITTLVSCGSEDKKSGINQAEDTKTGIPYVEEIYGATIEITDIPEDADKSTVKETYFLRASQSALIDSLQPTVTTVNIARLVWDAMPETERNKFTIIDVEVMKLDNKTRAAYSYPTTLLEEVSHKATNFNNFSKTLISGNFESLDAIIDENEIKMDVKKELKVAMNRKQKLFGDLIGYIPFGISELKDDKGIAYQYQGFLQFKNGKRQPYFVIIDAKKGLDKIIQFRITDE